MSSDSDFFNALAMNREISEGMCDGGGESPNVATEQEKGGQMCLADLPNLILLKILEYLDFGTVQQLRLVRKNIQTLIDFCFGLNLKLAWEEGEDGIREKWTNLRKKAVRNSTLEAVPLWLLQNNKKNEALLQYPFYLARVSMCFMDVRVVHKILTESERLVEFKYESSEIIDAPLPKRGKDFIGYVNSIPEMRMPLKYLVDLDLQISLWHGGNSDWANVLYILLALPATPSLRQFALHVNPEHLNFPKRTTFMLQACVLQFLKNRPSLQDLKLCLPIHSNTEEDPNLITLSENVISALCKKYGEPKVQSLLAELDKVKNPYSMLVLRMQMQDLCKNAGRALSRLRTLDLKLDAGRVVTPALLSFLEELQTVTNCIIHNTESRSATEENVNYTLAWRFLASQHALPHPPLKIFETLHSLRVVYTHAMYFRTFLLLNEVMDKFPSLSTLEVFDLGHCVMLGPSDVPKVGQEHLNEANGAVWVDFRGKAHVQRPTLRISKLDDMSVLMRLKKLRLSNVCVLHEEFIHLATCCSERS